MCVAPRTPSAVITRILVSAVVSPNPQLVMNAYCLFVVYPADIVKMIDSQPDLAPLIRRVRGGYLKIQGTWMPYEVCFHA